MKKRLLIIHHGAIGDALLSFPAITAAKRIFDRTDLLCQGKIGRLAVFLNVVDGFHPLESAGFSMLYSEKMSDKIVEFLGRYHSIVLISNAAAVKETMQDRFEGDIYMIPPRPDNRQRCHVAAYIGDHFQKYGLIKMDVCHNVIRGGFDGEKPGDPTVFIHPGSGSPRKNWPLSRFIDVYKKISEAGSPACFIVGPAEDTSARELSKYPVYSCTDLVELACKLESSSGFVGNDSGISHLAGLMGIPTVAIFGPSDPVRWRPVGTDVSVLRPLLDCEPCFETQKNNCETPHCLLQTTPEDVMKALDGYNR